MPKPSSLPPPDAPTFLPMLDLFKQMLKAGMLLTIDQYDLLRQALDNGYGLGDWEDLRDVCRMLWVKPSVNYDAELFEQVFDAYEAQYQQRFEDWLRQQQPPAAAIPQRQEISLGELPTIPRRRFQGESSSDTPSEESSSGEDGMDAVKHDRPKAPTRKPEYRVQVPISQETMKRTWRSLRRPIPNPRLQELDVEATVARIGREGLFTELVQQAVLQKKADLLLLVDDSQGMLPFAPVVQPLTDMVLARRISPAQLYRFQQCPTDYFYDWQRPLRGVSLAKILGQMNRLRTVVMIVSDAGAASPIYSQERVTRTGQFLRRLLPCVREVIWLNPLPERRWEGTTAAPIQAALAGRMVPFEAKQLQQLAQVRELKSGAQLWPMMRR